MILESPQTLVDGDLPQTLGPVVVQWMERALVHGPGDLAGRPLRLAPFWKKVLYRLYELDASGRRIVKRALVGTPKGCSKSEVAAGVALAELAGPVLLTDGRPSLRTDPDVPVAAASWEQADLVYGAARSMCKPIATHLEVFDTEILRTDAPGRLYRVAAAAGTNDGRRPTCVIADELHEWVGNKGRVHLVLANGLAKRDQSLELAITTAGADLDTTAGAMYEYGVKVASGEIDDPSFLFVWSTAPEACPLATPEQVRAAVEDAYPVGFVDLDAITSRFLVDRIPEYEFRRYFLNQWVAASGDWLPAGSWDDLTIDAGPPPDGTAVVVGFDGSYNRDATAMYGWTVDGERPHGWLIGLWERPDDAPQTWRVPRSEVEARLVDTFDRFDVVELVCDPYRWTTELEQWEARWGETVVEFPTASRRRMAEACQTAYAAIVQGDVTHSDDPEVSRHIRNAAVKETAAGPIIVKEYRSSPRRIDAAVAMIIGLHRCMWRRSQPEEEPVDALGQIW